MRQNRYETAKVISEYLLFHYGSEEDQMPWFFGSKEGLHFPVRCVTESLSGETLSEGVHALDLGCAVGRSSFELTRFCQRVVAVDRSNAFIDLAKQLQQTGKLPYTIPMEGLSQEKRIAELPKAIFPERVEFRCADALEVSGSFDLVLAANLLCRLPDPRAFLTRLGMLVKPKGLLVLATPYSWLEEFTLPDKWLSGQDVHEILARSFTLRRTFDLPFLIREHLRKYDWGVAQVTVWRRNDD